MGTVVAVVSNGGISPGPGPGPGPGPQPDPDVDPDTETIFTDEDWEKIAEVMETLLREFEEVIAMTDKYSTYVYIRKMVKEAYAQYYKGQSIYNIPYFYNESNFPNIYTVYDPSGDKDSDSVFLTMAGWLMAMQLAELMPKKRTSIYTIGYEVGGFTYESRVYGYQFKGDPNVARLIASAIYACLRNPNKLDPNISKYRKEVAGTTYSKTLQQIYDDTTRYDVGPDDLYVDLTKFMNCAPGPYDPVYASNVGILPTFPDGKASNKCLQLDMNIYNYVIDNFNLSDTSD